MKCQRSELFVLFCFFFFCLQICSGEKYEMKVEVKQVETEALVNGTCVVDITGPNSFTSQGNTFTGPNPGYFKVDISESKEGKYKFTTDCGQGYEVSKETHKIKKSGQVVSLSVEWEEDNNNNGILIEVRDEMTNSLLPSANIVITNSETSQSENISWKSPSYSWTLSGGYGSYIFSTSASGYSTRTVSLSVTSLTTLITLYMSRPNFCGDGVCSGSESANPVSMARCFDCGGLRGVVSLAVGQKDQLANITVSVWAEPINPASLMRAGQPLPPPTRTTFTDLKGQFSINSLSFDAPSGSQGQGQFKRRFYFRLTGSFIDRTGGDAQYVNLLPLWWNYELTNKQWSGSGDLTGTNNSPKLFFFMTPPFTTSQALARVILSWGSTISQPGFSLPDLDLVVAGPVNSESISQFGTGIVNFANKDQHSNSGSGSILPYAKLISDSAQGFGAEVFDFYSAPGSSSLQLGFSTSYSANAPANAYEIWVDRPNSGANADSFLVKLADTNSFLVMYYNDGTINQQQLFDQRTGVEYVYGFYNGDQWNKVPTSASMWHVFDLSLVEGGIKWTGFPGENGQDQSEPAGAKYAFNGQNFESTKSIPCGHTVSRGANPAYCPATLYYPQ